MFKQIKTILIVALIAIMVALPAYGSEPIAENSGALTSTKLLATGPGGVMFVLCQSTGIHVCGCTIYDSATASPSSVQLPGIIQYTTASMNAVSWMSTNPIRFTKGLYVIPSANSTCFVSWTYGQ
jgi:hypothetical protein